jgi:tetratricopeptide (TPR) repeat protein
MLTERYLITALSAIIFGIATRWLISAARAWNFRELTPVAGSERQDSGAARLTLNGSAIFLLVVVLATGAAAQGRPGSSPGGAPPSGGGGGLGSGVGMSMEMNEKGSVVVRVLGPHGMSLHQQAFVRLYSVNSGVLLSGGMTNLDGSLSFNNLPGIGYYTIEVSAAGYQTERKTFNVSDNITFTEVDVTMQPVGVESTATYDSASKVSDKARNHIDKGVIAFRAGKLKQAQKQLIDAYNAAPESPVTNYLLGVLYLNMKDVDRSEQYFTSAVRYDPKDVPALVGLGHVRYQKADLKGSEEALQKAVVLDAKQWEALWLLADIHLRQHDFEKAQKEAESAVEVGKGAANGAEFIEAEAWAELGRTPESLKTLRAFLKDAPSDPNAPVARRLAERLEMETAAAPVNSTRAVAIQSAPTAPNGASPVVAVSAPKFPLPDWEPPSVDQERPPIADGVTCPAAEVIKQAGDRVSELVDSVNRIDATEKVTHEELSTLGRPVLTEKRRFDYMISITHSDWGLLNVSEDRQGEGSPFLGHVSMFGLADLPLIFHPSLRRDFQLTCEGLGKWQGRATWLVYFRQRSDRPERIRSYQLLDGSSYNAALKGRAWIVADSYQIVCIEAELMKALPEVGIGSEEDVIEYAPVPFQSKNVVLWLPSTADIYYFYKHVPYHRHHAFTDYRLFSVSSSQKIDLPDASVEKNDRR